VLPETVLATRANQGRRCSVGKNAIGDHGLGIVAQPDVQAAKLDVRDEDKRRGIGSADLASQP
jgi:hypothetical protein